MLWLLKVGEAQVRDVRGPQATRRQFLGLPGVEGEDPLEDKLRRERDQLRARPHNPVKAVGGVDRHSVGETRRYSTPLRDSNLKPLASPSGVEKQL
ncbi:hypothetical protein SMICM304S_04431 [Streptomyces microflavus]